MLIICTKYLHIKTLIGVRLNDWILYSNQVGTQLFITTAPPYSVFPIDYFKSENGYIFQQSLLISMSLLRVNMYSTDTCSLAKS